MAPERVRVLRMTAAAGKKYESDYEYMGPRRSRAPTPAAGPGSLRLFRLAAPRRSDTIHRKFVRVHVRQTEENEDGDYLSAHERVSADAHADVLPASLGGDLEEETGRHQVRQRDENEVHLERRHALKLEQGQERDGDGDHRNEHLQHQQPAHEERVEPRGEAIHRTDLEGRHARDVPGGEERGVDQHKEDGGVTRISLAYLSRFNVRFELDDRGGRVAQLAEHPEALHAPFQDEPRERRRAQHRVE